MGSKFNADSSVKTKCYFIRNDNNSKLTCQFNPTGVPYSRSANFSDISAPGMSYPLVQYTGGNSRNFDIELFYYDKPYSGKIDKARNYLLGLFPPEKNVSSFTKPPTFTFAYGYFVKKLVATNIEINDEWIDSNGRPIMTRFKLSVRQVGA